MTRAPKKSLLVYKILAMLQDNLVMSVTELCGESYPRNVKKALAWMEKHKLVWRCQKHVVLRTETGLAQAARVLPLEGQSYAMVAVLRTLSEHGPCTMQQIREHLEGVATDVRRPVEILRREHGLVRISAYGAGGHLNAVSYAIGLGPDVKRAPLRVRPRQAAPAMSTQKRPPAPQAPRVPIRTYAHASQFAGGVSPWA